MKIDQVVEDRRKNEIYATTKFDPAIRSTSNYVHSACTKHYIKDTKQTALLGSKPISLIDQCSLSD